MEIKPLRPFRVCVKQFQHGVTVLQRRLSTIVNLIQILTSHSRGRCQADGEPGKCSVCRPRSRHLQFRCLRCNVTSECNRLRLPLLSRLYGKAGSGDCEFVAHRGEKFTRCASPAASFPFMISHTKDTLLSNMLKFAYGNVPAGFLVNLTYRTSLCVPPERSNNLPKI